MDKLVLFDINNTLLRDTNDVSEYVSESIRNIYGTLVDVNLSKYRGMTSQEIAEAVLRENGMQQAEIEKKLTRYTEDLFYTYYNVAGHNRQIILDGAKELLDELSRRDPLIGIATGEVERVARFRLEKTGFSNYFKFGAYGDEAKDAEGILDIAIKKAEEFTFSGSPFLVCNSPQFIQAARRAGVRIIGISNDIFSVQELKEAGADLAVNNLKDKNKIISMLG